MMGAPDNAERMPNVPGKVWPRMARPLHEETVPSFRIGKYKVTATEYCAFLNEVSADAEETSKFIHLDNSPITQTVDGAFEPRPGYEWTPAYLVSYRGARRYCEWLSAKTGKRIRLPSEIEWEYAARGTEGRTYPWGEQSPVGRAFFIEHYYKSDRMPDLGVVNVGMFPNGATAEGVHDMIGIVSEWCGNYYYEYSMDSIGKDPERFERFVNALDPVTRPGRSLPLTAYRGGGYVHRAKDATANGWTRFVGGRVDLVPAYRGKGFRILEEIKDVDEFSGETPDKEKVPE